MNKNEILLIYKLNRERQPQRNDERSEIAHGGLTSCFVTVRRNHSEGLLWLKPPWAVRRVRRFAVVAFSSKQKKRLHNLIKFCLLRCFLNISSYKLRFPSMESSIVFPIRAPAAIFIKAMALPCLLSQ